MVKYYDLATGNGRERERERERERDLTTHSTHFIYGYTSDIWLRTILIVRKETRCHHIGYSYRLTARFFYMHHPTDRITHTTAFVTAVVEHWLDWEQETIFTCLYPIKVQTRLSRYHRPTKPANRLVTGRRGVGGGGRGFKCY